jgi:hypothetical protein
MGDRFANGKKFLPTPFEGLITQMVDQAPLATIQATGSWSNCSIVRERSMAAKS